ncbi:MAG: S-layer homology domain-containing protein [Candidatus Dormibacteraeota bacterium]|nr:S-layer homology domain-containing protein [Candidatus Dormibacteraeota bacterium]
MRGRLAGSADATPSPAGSPTPLRPTTTHTPDPPTVTVSAGSTATATPTPCARGFSDVHPSDYFYPPVLYLACRGVLSGYADGTFRPYASTTSSQMVKIVVLGFAIPLSTPVGGASTFQDVPPSHPFFAAVETAALHSIVSGYTCGQAPAGPCVPPQNRPYFLPFAPVTRGQLAKIDVATAGWPLIDPASGTYADVRPGTAFYRFVETAACRGLVSGYACGGLGEPCGPGGQPYFRPNNSATRGKIAKIVYQSITSPPGACGGPAMRP